MIMLWKDDKIRSYFWGAFFSVSLCCILCLFCFIFLFNCTRPQLNSISLIDDTLVKEVEQRKGLVEWSQLRVDSLNSIKLSEKIDSVAFIALRDSIFRMEHQAGRIMTPNELSDSITGYYDKLIDVLIALFILFTFLGYIVVDRRFRQQYESDKEEIKNGLETNLREHLKDSSDFRSGIVSSLKSEVDDVLASHDDVAKLNHSLKEQGEYIELLITSIDEIREDIDANVYIDDENDGVAESLDEE